jgi:hypothetical protein
MKKYDGLRYFRLFEMYQVILYLLYGKFGRGIFSTSNGSQGFNVSGMLLDVSWAGLGFNNF